MQINLTGFLNGKNAREFMRDLWPLLLSAQDNIAGIPSAFLEQKKEEIRQRQVIVLLNSIWRPNIARKLVVEPSGFILNCPPRPVCPWRMASIHFSNNFLVMFMAFVQEKERKKCALHCNEVMVFLATLL